MDTETFLTVLGILGMRILGISLGTMRTLLMVRGKKPLATTISLFEFATYAFSVGWVVQDLTNPWILASYCGGSAAGIYAGMFIESRFVTGFATINVISPHKAHEIAVAVREAGFGATEGWGQGAEGTVGTIRVVVRRQEVSKVLDAINSVEHSAFITVEETRSFLHGYLRANRWG